MRLKTNEVHGGARARIDHIGHVVVRADHVLAWPESPCGQEHVACPRLYRLCEVSAGVEANDGTPDSLEACKKVIEETVPEGAGRDQALAACENSG